MLDLFPVEGTQDAWNVVLTGFCIQAYKGPAQALEDPRHPSSAMNFG